MVRPERVEDHRVEVEVECRQQGLPMAGDKAEQLVQVAVGVGADLSPPTVQDQEDQDIRVEDLDRLEVDHLAGRPVDRRRLEEDHLADRPVDRLIQMARCPTEILGMRCRPS